MTEIRSDSAGIYVEVGGRYARPGFEEGAGLEAGRHVRAALNADETEIRVRWGGNEETWPAHVSRRASRVPAGPVEFKYELGQIYENAQGRTVRIVEVFGPGHRYPDTYNITARCDNDRFYNPLGYMGSSKPKQQPGDPLNLVKRVG